MIRISDIKREAGFLFGHRHVRWMLVVACALSIFAVWSGMTEVNAQRATIDRLLEKDAEDRADVLSKHEDFGSLGYYTFHLAYEEPSALAFAAMGQRDVLPWKHRIRMLALEGQIYETDADNPELSMVGRFDFAFYTSVLMPLFILLLLYDVRSGEREAGREDLLLVTATSRLWLTRSLVLTTSVLSAVLLPFWIGAGLSQASLAGIFQTSTIVVGHAVFWGALALYFGSSKRFATRHSTSIASILIGLWLFLAVIIPVVADTVIQSSIQSPSGGEILLTQREAVNDAWDLPYEDTWLSFLETHPEWTEQTAMGDSFEWKWYYAFQQVGDQKAQALSDAYRAATRKRSTWARRISFLSPPMLSQHLMSATAGTHTEAMLAYEHRVREFHRSLRMFHYPLLFNAETFSRETMAKRPHFEPATSHRENASISGP